MKHVVSYLASDFGPRTWTEKIIRWVFWFIPTANPDYEDHFQHIRAWYVELDEKGEAVRELGLDSDGKPVCGGPDERNVGFWTDLDGEFPLEKSSEIDQSVFSAKWNELYGHGTDA